MNTEHVGTQHEISHAVSKRGMVWKARHAVPTDSYGLVLGLVVLAYVLISTNITNAWWGVCIVVVQGLTLVLALRTSRAGPLWVMLASAYLVVGTALALVDAVFSGARPHSVVIQAFGGILLFVTPVTILRHIVTHNNVTAQTILGGITIYVLIGFCFASLYTALSFLSHTPFFVGVQHTTRNDYLFFSYSTLTTVGYGNLVPAGNMGQTFAMLEALLGQVYLVIIVARLVSLWGAPQSSGAGQSADGEQ